MSAALNALCTSGRESAMRATESRISSAIVETLAAMSAPVLPGLSAREPTTSLHPEHAEARRWNRRVQRRRNREAEHVARLRRIDDAVVPQPRAREIRVALT